jgi:cytochrome c
MLRTTVGILAVTLACLSNPAQAQDATAGERVFKAQCGACHSPLKGKDMAGPSMWGVLGRGGPFTSTTQFEQYLENPKKVIPETTMAYAGLKNPKQRKDLIAYLETLK